MNKAKKLWRQLKLQESKMKGKPVGVYFLTDKGEIVGVEPMISENLPSPIPIKALFKNE